MATDDWSDRDAPKTRSSSSSKKGGPSDLIRIFYPISNLASLRKGGKVRKDGPANLHKGERVIPRSKVKRVEKMMRKSKMRMRSSGM